MAWIQVSGIVATAFHSQVFALREGITREHVAVPVCQRRPAMRHNLTGDVWAGAGQMRLSARVEEVRTQMSDLQLQGLATLGDEAQVWQCRTKFAALRPTGWRSDPDKHVPCRRVLLLQVVALVPCSLQLHFQTTSQVVGSFDYCKHMWRREECFICLLWVASLSAQA